MKIARFMTNGLKYLATIRADLFSLEDVLDRFGGGEYYIRVFDGARYVQSFRIAMDPSIPVRDA